eukprot:TRINITY_DN10106_c0_g1_i1.p2 TRINITY_DN10106_c0_g1~~TRINITY_DN10106_c0_g1_i1.p2  ORF type:complete len:176 (-),score=76.14 TRINITY_DN10106_c0_g1_i1:165-692(-)
MAEVEKERIEGKNKSRSSSVSSSDEEKKPKQEGKEKAAEGKFLYDLYIKGKYLIAAVDMPGMRREDFNIAFDGDVLSISGDKKVKENKDFKYLVQQRTAGPFELAIEISKHNIEVRKKDIEARYKNGVLKVALRLKKVEDISTVIQVSFKSTVKKADNKEGGEGKPKEEATEGDE